MALLDGKWIGSIFEQETPTGLVNGSNTVYLIPSVPHSNKAVMVFINGLMQRQGIEYTISGSTITMTQAPLTGQDIFIFYVKRDA